MNNPAPAKQLARIKPHRLTEPEKQIRARRYERLWREFVQSLSTPHKG